MAGRPIYRASVKRIEDMGGEEWVISETMAGITVGAICAATDVTRGMFYQWIHKGGDRWEKFQQARRLGAFALADQAQEIVDSSDPLNIAVDRERAKIRTWLAERANREAFGAQKEQAQVLNVGELHLHALQQSESAAPTALPAESSANIEDAEFEVEPAPAPALDDML
jgi:hypothetical protein